VPLYTDEAGFDVLVGSADSRIPSQLYTEKVYVLSKAFIKTALTSPLQGLDGIIKWLYLTSPEASPRLLRRVVEDSEALLPETSTANVVDEVRSLRDEPTLGPTRLSAGALILLRRNLVWLKDYLEHDQEQK
jgi:ubiquitin-conjugating enzyme E2 O